ncbi:MAG: EMC3/TMCO1 family protein [Candidatus Micrarchaeota archaeon]
MFLQAIAGIDDTTSIIVLTLLITIVNNAILFKYGKRNETQAIQKEINEWNAAIKKAQKEKNEAELNQLLAKNDEMMKKMSGMMMMSFKTLIFTLPLYIILYSFVLPALYPEYTILLPFDIHFNALFALNVFKEATYGARGLFIVAAIPFGIILQSVVSRINKKQ